MEMLHLVSNVVAKATIVLVTYTVAGNTQGSIILFEPTTSEHISSRTLDQIAVTALAPSADCRTFAIG
jgi:hypothetical protein